MRLKNNKSGFTLLEIIIVIIIVGVLASLALPRLFQMIEFSRSMEAQAALGVLKRGADNCAYLVAAGAGRTVVVSADYATCITFGTLGVDDPALSPGALFTYVISPLAGATWSATANRNGTGNWIRMDYNTAALGVDAVTFTGNAGGPYEGLQ